MKLVSKKRSLAFAGMLVASIGVAPGYAQNGQPLQTLQTDVTELKAQVATLASQASVSALQTQLTALTTLIASLQNPTTKTSEVWRLGITPTVDGLTGQLRFATNPFYTVFNNSNGLSVCGTFPNACSSAAVAYFNAIPTRAVRVAQVQVLVANRAGASNGVNLVVEVRASDEQSRVISTAPINLAAVNQAQYVEVPIVDSDAAIVAPGEQLRIRLTSGGSGGGDLGFNLGAIAVVQTP